MTLLIAICADGSKMPPFYIFKGSRLSPELLKEGVANSTMATQKSGWITKELFLQYIKNFINFVKDKRGLRKKDEGEVDGNEDVEDATETVLLLCDGHSSRYSSEVIEFALANNVIILLSPPNCTPYVQPLDVGVFSSFKTHIANESYSLMQKCQELDRYDMARLTKSPYEKISPNIILNSFKKAGIYPPNIHAADDLILKNKTETKRQKKKNTEEISENLQKSLAFKLHELEKEVHGLKQKVVALESENDFLRKRKNEPKEKKKPKFLKSSQSLILTQQEVVDAIKEKEEKKKTTRRKKRRETKKRRQRKGN